MKKSLSILLALLMILSSLPVMAFTASAEEAEATNPNVLKDYTYQDWQGRKWSRTEQGAEGIGNGNRMRISESQNQVTFTTVTLEPNTEYSFDFNWKAETNEVAGGLFPAFVYVYALSDYGSNEALLSPSVDYGANYGDYIGSGKWHEENADFYPVGKDGSLFSTGTDLETYADNNGLWERKSAPAGTWQHFSTHFTTTDETQYAIFIRFEANHTNDRGGNALQTSDFRLISNEDKNALPLEDRNATDWVFDAWVYLTDDNTFTQDGITSQYKWSGITWQTIYTEMKLLPNTKYTFSFDSYLGSSTAEGDPRIGAVKITGDGVDVLDKYPAAQGKDSWHHSQYTFTTNSSENYKISFIGDGSDFKNNGTQVMYLANLKIKEFVVNKPGNLLNNASYANGAVTWTTATDLDNKIGNIDARDGNYVDNPDNSVNGGYSWAFGFGDGRVGGDTANYTDPMYKDVYAYVYIKANGLKAGKTYDFSYIYRLGFYFTIDSIKSGNNTATFLTELAKQDMPAVRGEMASILFKVPVDGDYVIALKSNRNCSTVYNTWSETYLSDLELYERGAMYNVAVTKDGNGFAKATKEGLVEEGSEVTFTAKPETFERFLGWYNGDELLSEETVYTVAVAGDINLVGKFTAYGTNLMANYNTSNFVTRDWGSVVECESRYGGNGIRANNSPHQSLITKVNLEAGKEYTLSFDWKPVENVSNKEFISSISVQKILTPDIDILYKPNNDGKPYEGQLGGDIETGSGYSSQEIANTCTWQNTTTTFTPTESGEYAISIGLGHNAFASEEEVAEYNRVNGTNLDITANNNQSVDFSSFVLKTKPEITYTGTKYDWHGERWSFVEDSEDTKDGGYAYLVNNAMNQSISTTLEGLKPGATYKFSFNWKAIENASGLAYVQAAQVFSVNSGSNVHPKIDGQPDWDAPCNYEHYGEGAGLDYRPSYIPNDGYANVRTSFDNPNGTSEVDDAVLTNWNTASGTFKTTDDADYYFFIVFGLKGSNGNQSAIISDLVIEEVVEGAAPAGDAMISHPGVSIRKASESFYGQALRFKFTVDGNVIANAQADGYELVEYGTVVALTDSLAGHAADPILDATSYSVKTGVAYNKDDGTNVQFAVDGEGNVTYTAALYNIPTNQYGKDIAVRPYAIFRNAEGATYVRYGTTRTASVFAVVKAVLEGNNTDDKAYVNNNMLVGDVETAYNEWLNK